jgi:hypothetical protein
LRTPDSFDRCQVLDLKGPSPLVGWGVFLPVEGLRKKVGEEKEE